MLKLTGLRGTRPRLTNESRHESGGSEPNHISDTALAYVAEPLGFALLPSEYYAVLAMMTSCWWRWRSGGSCAVSAVTCRRLYRDRRSLPELAHVRVFWRKLDGRAKRLRLRGDIQVYLCVSAAIACS